MFVMCASSSVLIAFQKLLGAGYCTYAFYFKLNKIYLRSTYSEEGDMQRSLHAEFYSGVLARLFRKALGQTQKIPHIFLHIFHFWNIQLFAAFSLHNSQREVDCCNRLHTCQQKADLHQQV